MTGKRITIRLSEADYNIVQTKARAVGATVTETARALLVSGGDGGSQAAALAEVFGAVIDRLEAIEQRPAEASTAPDLAPIAQRMERVERALGSLISAVERLYQPAGMTAPRTEPALQPTAIPTGKRPAPIGGFASWVRDQPWAHNDETPPERARRLLPTYNAQFDPPHQLPGG